MDYKSYTDCKVIIGDKIYASSAANWEQTYGKYPRVEVDAYIDPQYCVGKYTPSNSSDSLMIKNIIFNPPATIIFWSDNTKTVVKCDLHCESYDPEKGIAMAISKKMLGNNKYEYYNTFKHWLKKWDKHVNKETVELHSALQAMSSD